MREKKDLHLAIFTGHSGGHLFPAAAFSETFRKEHPGCRLDLLTSRKAVPILGKLPPRLFDSIHFLPDFPFLSKNLWTLFRMAARVPSAFVTTWNYLSRAKPDLCVGFGSYVSYPGLLLASLKGIPCVLHEQNFRGGKANEWLLRHVDEVAVSFERTWRNRGLKSRHWTGLPLRSRLLESPGGGRNAIKMPQGRFRLLILGGSQGAHRLNELCLEAIRAMNSEEKEKIAVNHITGSSDYEWAVAAYQDLGVSAQVYPFHENMKTLYEASDLAVTRAGANTLFELAHFRLPAIVIPYPFAESHQSENAAYFESHGGVLVHEERDLTANDLLQDIRFLRDHPEELEGFSKNLSELSVPDAAEKLVNLTNRFVGANN